MPAWNGPRTSHFRGTEDASPVTRDFVSAGDSLTADTYTSAGFRWGMALAGAPVRLVYNAGVANDTLDDLWARWTTDVIDKLPTGGYILLRIGTNSVGDASFTTKYQRFVDDVIGRSGFKMVMFALPPKSSSGATIAGHNAAIAAMVALNPSKLAYIQDSTDLGDGSYNYLAAYYIDTIHMNAKGQYTQGVAMASQLLSFIGAGTDPRPTTGDNYTDNPASNQWVKNPLMAGGGSVATNWGVAANGSGSTVSASIVAADGGDPNTTPWQRMAITAVGAANHTFSISTTLGHPAVSASGSPARLELVAEIRFNALDTTNLTRLKAYLQKDANVPVVNWSMQLGGNGTITHTCVIHQSLARVTSQAFSANTLNLYFEVLSAAAAGSIGSIDVRCVAVRALES